MKVNTITTNIAGYTKLRDMKRPADANVKCAYERHNLKENNNDQINTTIKRNSDGRACFKGGVPLLHRAAEFAGKNPLVAEALFAIVVTCALRPLTIMATAKTEEDKEKCSYQAAKSISSGVIGLLMTAVVATPMVAGIAKAKGNNAFAMPDKVKQESAEIVKKGVDVLDEYAKKLIAENKNTELAQQIQKLTKNGKINLSVFKKAGKCAEKLFINNIKEEAPDIYKPVKDAIKNQRVLTNYSSTMKNVMDKIFQPIVMPIKAHITIAMVPVVLGLLGLSKNSSKKAQAPAQKTDYTIFNDKNNNEIFETFSGVTKHENK